MIPKKIHYCWFGGKPLPQQAVQCIASWKKHCPDYEIIRWDENNYCIEKNPYMQQAYEAKKWGFVPDYARLDIIYQHGGIYLDTDVEILRPFDTLLQDSAFMGFEAWDKVNLGQGFGAEAGHPLIREMRDLYDGLLFRNEDGGLNTTASPYYQTLVLKQHGLALNNQRQTVRGAHVYPTDFFCPKDLETGKIKITENTYSIHYFDASWMTPRQRFHMHLAQKLGPQWTRRLKRLMGKA